MMNINERPILFGLNQEEGTSIASRSSLVECFSDRVAETPTAIALVDEWTTLTYAELDRRSTDLARYLVAAGLAPGATVGLAMQRSIAYPIAVLGIIKAGGAYVPFDCAWTDERLAFVIADARIKYAIIDEQTDVSLLGGVRTIDLVRDAHEIRGEANERALPQTTLDSLAYVMYTSGSTGRPKGVVIEHRAILRLVRGTDFIEITSADVFLMFAPPAFDASTFELWAPLLNGARLAIAPPGPRSLEEVGSALERFGVTILWLTAPLFRMMVETELERFTGIRTLITGGDIVSAEHAKRFLSAAPACRFVNGYGPTENTTFSCAHTVGSAAEIDGSIPIGKPIARSSAYVLSDDLRELPEGIAGELFVGGDGLAREYLNLPDLTAERFIPNPLRNDGSRLYRTGDRVRKRPDGVLEFLGRIDNQVKIRGIRIEIEEIERALHAHPGVLHAAVVVEERVGEKSLHACIVRVAGSSTRAADVRAFLALRLSAYMIPSRFSFRSELPAFSSGKIDRVSLSKEVQNEGNASGAARPPVLGRSAPTGDTAEIVTLIWQTTLGANFIGPDENFFDAGGDSLLLHALHTRLCQRFGMRLRLTDLFRECTIRKQAAMIERGQA